MNPTNGAAVSRVRRIANAWENARAHEWWEFKIPPLLATAYATALILHVSIAQLWPLLLLVIVALLPGAAYVCVLNDITDLEEDRQCGKANRMAGKSWWFKFFALTICLLPGLAVGWTMRHDAVTLPLYILNWFVFTFYSVPPIRLKTRGLGGVLMDASGSHLLPTLWTSTLIAEATGHAIPVYFLATLGVWAMMLGLRGILWHQLYDRDNDQRGRVTTFVAGRNPQSVRRFVAWIAFPIEVLALLLILVQADTAWAWAMLAVYLVGEWLVHRFMGIDIILVQPTPRYRIILAEYYQLQFPLTFLLAISQDSLAALVLVALQLILFPHCVYVFVAQLLFIAKWRLIPAVQARINRLGCSSDPTHIRMRRK